MDWSARHLTPDGPGHLITFFITLKHILTRRPEIIDITSVANVANPQNMTNVDFENVHPLPSFEDSYLFITGFHAGTTKSTIKKLVGASRVGFVDFGSKKMVADFASANEAQDVLMEQLRNGIACSGATLILRLATTLETSTAFNSTRA